MQRTLAVTYPSSFLLFLALLAAALPVIRGEYEIYTYHTQVDWREGLWHRQIIERIQHVIQLIFLGEEKHTAK